MQTFTAAHLLASAMLVSARLVSNLKKIELCSSLLVGILAGHIGTGNTKVDMWR